MKKGVNVIEKIMTGLDNSWDDLTKARYLYLKSCEFFTYDERYLYLCTTNYSIIDDLRNREIDLENVTDNRVLCDTWSREVYNKLLIEAGIDSRIIGQGRAHQYITFNADDYNIVADATISSDIARAKMKLDTKSFYSENGKRLTCDTLKEIDKSIGYIEEDYSNDTILQMIGSFIKNNDELELSCFLDKSLQREIMLDKMYIIKNIFETFTDVKSYNDLKFIIEYLKRKVFTKDENKVLFDYIEWFDPSKDDWDFTTIYKLDNDINFALTNPGDGYCFYETTKSDIKQIKKRYPKQ